MSVSRRDSILDAALPVFLAHGVAGASIGEIQAASGASVGSIYHWFGTKEGIAAALYCRALAGYQAGVVATLRAHEDAEAGVRQVVAGYLRWVEGHPDDARFLLEVRVAPGDELRALNRSFFAEVVGWAEPRLRVARIELVYALWLGPGQELARMWLAGSTPDPPGAHAEILADAAWSALRP